ncbi:MAG: ABC-type glycerol-3-phosphate transport system substrate-binding protein [Myxococcota bacterium]|jgi:ABC-type glycerol-3-phosphate transport system substrate-binding protein
MSSRLISLIIGCVGLSVLAGSGCRGEKTVRPTRDRMRVLIPELYKRQIIEMLESESGVTLPSELEWVDVPFYDGRDAVFAPSLAARFSHSDPDADVFFIDLYRLGSFRPSWLTPLPTDGFAADFRPAFLEAAHLGQPGPLGATRESTEEAVYAVPWSAKGNFLFYRRDLVAEPPKSWAQLREICERVEVARPGRLRYCLLLDWGSIENDLYPALWSLFDHPSLMRLDAPEVVEFLVDLTTMLGAELASGMKMMPSVDHFPRVGSRVHERFAGGETVFMISWNNRYKFMADLATKRGHPMPDTGIAPIPPVISGATAWSNIGTWGWIVPQRPDDATEAARRRHAEAIEFIRVISSGPAVKFFVETQGILPARRDVDLPTALAGALSPSIVNELDGRGDGSFRFRDRGSDSFVHGFVRDAIRDVLSCGSVRPGSAQVGISGDCGRFHEECLKHGGHPEKCVSEAVRLRLQAAQDNIDQVRGETSRVGVAPSPGASGDSSE